MKNGSKMGRVAGVLAILAIVGMPLAAAQEKPAAEAQGKPCNAYRVDNAKNRVYFNAPEPWIAIPTATERTQLRLQGELGQVFMMENCDTPDLVSRVNVYEKPNDDGNPGTPIADVASGQPVLILEQRGDWYRVRGRPANVGAPQIWRGEGWIKTGKKTVVVKY